MTDKRDPKNSEKLEIRLPYETKRDFLAACRQAGRTASDVVREAVRGFIDRQRHRRETEHRRLLVVPRPVRKKRYLALGAVGVLSVIALSALPSAADPDLSVRFARLDTDKDGKLSKEEFAAAITGKPQLSISGDTLAFNQYTGETYFYDIPLRNTDAKDTGIKVEMVAPTPEELAKQREGRTRAFERMDADKDGVVTGEEYMADAVVRSRKEFDPIDKNRDGIITLADLPDTPSRPWGDHPEARAVLIRSKDGSMRWVDSVETPPPYSYRNEVMSWDTNKDGAVSFEEYFARPSGF